MKNSENKVENGINKESHQAGTNTPSDYKIRKQRYEHKNSNEVKAIVKRIGQSFLLKPDVIELLEKLKKDIEDKLETLKD